MVNTIILELLESEAKKVAAAAELYGFSSQAELVHEALRRSLDSHTTELQEEYVMQDVSWGLQGWT